MIAPLWAYDTLDIEANVSQHSTVNQKINIYHVYMVFRHFTPKVCDWPEIMKKSGAKGVQQGLNCH